jgi:ribonuclease-3
LGSLFRPAPERPAPRGAEPGRGTNVDLEARVVAEFGRHYGLTFNDPKLVKLALTHRSYLHVTGQRDSNERLEFLGDSVLGLVTSEFLYLAHPTEHEGQLTKTKSLLVSKAILSRRALAMGLGRFVLMSHSEVESGGRQRLSILADAFESVVGAIYLDLGFEAARAFIERWLLRDTRTIVADKRHTNYKSHLQEYVQSTYRTHPVYRIRSEMGPDHSKQFMVEVIVGRRTLGEGKGRNKKEAEQAAARDALERVEGGPTSDRGREADARRAPAERPERGQRPLRSRTPPATVVEEDLEVEDEELEFEVDESAGPATIGETTVEEREVVSRRRRRGRRGGRGRRRSEEGAGAEAAPSAPRLPPRASETPAPPVAPPPPRREPERGRLEERERERNREREAERERNRERDRGRVVMAPPAELEPLPPAYEEDELDDVGRPEGPPGDFPVEPPSWLADLKDRVVEERAPVFEEPAVESSPHEEDRSDWMENSLDEQTPETPPAPEPEPPAAGRPAGSPGPTGVQYGRRGRPRR